MRDGSNHHVRTDMRRGVNSRECLQMQRPINPVQCGTGLMNCLSPARGDCPHPPVMSPCGGGLRFTRIRLACCASVAQMYQTRAYRHGSTKYSHSPNSLLLGFSMQPRCVRLGVALTKVLCFAWFQRWNDSRSRLSAVESKNIG